MGFVACVALDPSEAAGGLVQTVAFFPLCAICVRGDGLASAFMARTPLRWLGNISYSYYLAHGFAIRIATVALARALPGGMSDWMFWALMPVLYAAALAASWVLFVMVEKPFSLQPTAAPASRRSWTRHVRRRAHHPRKTFRIASSASGRTFGKQVSPS